MKRILPIYKMTFCAIALFIKMNGFSQKAMTQGKSSKMIDYVTVGKLYEQIAWPYVVHLKKGKKELMFIGTTHPTDTSSNEFAIIEKRFHSFKPDVTLNEGGEVASEKRYKNKLEAIKKNGEIGLLKYLSDQKGIKMVNGDFDEITEFGELLKIHPTDDLLLYVTIERCLYGFTFNTDTTKSVETVYEDFVKNYLRKNGFPLSEEQMKWAYFTKLYEKKMNTPFDLEQFNIELFDFFNPNCFYCEIGRSSKMIRDKVLIANIQKAFDRYDKVLVVFGGAHLLATEPVLKEMMR